MTKQILSLLFVGATFMLSAQTPAKTPAGVPAGSSEVGPGTYRFVDKDKKVWIYRKTPFGFQKSEETAADGDRARKTETAPAEMPQADRNRTATPFGESKAPAAGMPTTKVTETGDSVQFERPSPFGVYRWTKKKTELTDGEKKLWEAQRSASSAQANEK